MTSIIILVQAGSVVYGIILRMFLCFEVLSIFVTLVDCKILERLAWIVCAQIGDRFEILVWFESCKGFIGGIIFRLHLGRRMSYSRYLSLSHPTIPPPYNL